MLAGLPDSDLGIAHAEELLAVAQNGRRTATVRALDRVGGDIERATAEQGMTRNRALQR